MPVHDRTDAPEDLSKRPGGKEPDTTRWPNVIGIVGGLGPHAHIELERRLLAAVGSVDRDQEYPSWVLSSMPGTPDRTAAILGVGESPVAAIAQSIERLRSAGADFAVVACNTAHAFIAELETLSSLPILNIVDETILEATRHSDGGIVGLLATTGTLKSGVYHEAINRLAPDCELLSPLDLPEGARQQETLIMESIYGRPSNRVNIGGIKAGHMHDPETGKPYSEAFAEAARLLGNAGARCVLLGCTEISLCLTSLQDLKIHLIDPVEVAARESIRIARGQRGLPPFPTRGTTRGTRHSANLLKSTS